MKKIIEYQIISHPDQSTLSEVINHYITMGWEPFGSLSIVNYENKINDFNTKRVYIFYQVIVKYQD